MYWLVVEPYPSEKWWSSSVGMMTIPNINGKSFIFPYIYWYSNNPYIDDASIPILLMFVKQNPLINNVNPGLINPVYDCLIGKVQ